MGLPVSEDESTTIMTGSMVAGRQGGRYGAGAEAESYLQAPDRKTGHGKVFEISKPTPSSTPPPTRPLLILPNSSTN